MTVGDRLLKDVTELKLVSEKLALIDTKLEAKDNLIELLRQDVAASEAIADKWKVAFEEQVEVTHAQQKYYESEIKALKKWYRSPVLWFSVGVIVTGALAVGLNYGLAETRN
jgi:predicted  nucleic acid-binding Zn-ribbon protein